MLLKDIHDRAQCISPIRVPPSRSIIRRDQRARTSIGNNIIHDHYHRKQPRCTSNDVSVRALRARTFRYLIYLNRALSKNISPTIARLFFLQTHPRSRSLNKPDMMHFNDTQQNWHSRQFLMACILTRFRPNRSSSSIGMLLLDENAL